MADGPSGSVSFLPEAPSAWERFMQWAAGGKYPATSGAFLGDTVLKMSPMLDPEVERSLYPRPDYDRDVTPLLQTPSNYPSAHPGGQGRHLAPNDTDLSNPPYTPQPRLDGHVGLYGAQPDQLDPRPDPTWLPSPIPLWQLTPQGKGMDDQRPDLLHLTSAKAIMDDTSPPAAPAAAPPPVADTPAPGSLDTGGDSISPTMRSFLNGVAGPESGGRYDIRYGGASGPQTFNGYDTHPNVVSKIPGTDTTSTAAGKYQFLQSTWAPIAEKLGLKDFSPDSQDRGAAYLATSTYKRVTGRDLEADLQDPARHSAISTALHSQWPTLTGRNIGIAMGAAPPTPNAPAPAMMASAPEAAPQSDPMAQLKLMNRLQMLNQFLPQQGKAAAPAYNPGGNTSAILAAGRIPESNPLQTMMQLARLRNPLYSFYG